MAWRLRPPAWPKWKDNFLKSESNAAKFFNGFAKDFDTLYDGQRNFFMRWLDQHFRKDMFLRYAWTFDSFGDLTNKSVLDIGCGSGPYVIEAFRRGAKAVTAVDPAPGMLALVGEKLRSKRLVQKCTLVEGLFPGVELQRHHHAIVMGVMDYVRDPRDFLAQLKPLVSVSAAVSFPSRHWLRTPLREFRYRLRNCPVYFYTDRDIRRLCEEAGFRGIAIRKIHGAGMDYHVLLKP